MVEQRNPAEALLLLLPTQMERVNKQHSRLAMAKVGWNRKDGVHT
jgi:hypothetical protein